ncbi:MAG TPA: transglycosylase SLT domain-containing protein [Candidatus Paceibacterota bacterium]|nr:transglycosylase SLT domain-containing protein [Candidatus Paceibacterota bacterium]
MSNILKLTLSKITYHGSPIGREIRVDIEALGQKLNIEEKIKVEETKEINREVARVDIPRGSLSADVSITVTEKDFLFNDIGRKNVKINIDPGQGWPQLFHFDVDVFENRSKFWKKKAKKAVFAIELFAEVASEATGKIALYPDIGSYITDAKMRKEPNDKSEILAQILNHSQVEIFQIGKEGNYADGYFSDLWHEIAYNGQRGFTHSSLIEIEGQDRKKIIEAIKSKAKELGIDEKLAVNLAYYESHWLPYAHRLEADDKGIYQLTPVTIQEINQRQGGNILNPYDPFQNIDGGLRYLKYLLERYVGSKNSLERTITAWNYGPSRVLVTGDFNLRDYPKETQNLVENVLKKRLGEKIMKTLGIIAMVILFGGPVIASVPLLDYIGEDLSCDFPLVEKENGLALYDEECKEILYLTSKDFYADKTNVYLSDEEKENGILFSNKPVVVDNKGALYFLVTESSYCGRGICAHTLYKYNPTNKELNIINNEIVNPIELLISPSMRFLAIHSSTGGICDPVGAVKIIDLEMGDSVTLEPSDKELTSSSIEDVRWISDAKMGFTAIYTGGCYDMFKPPVWIIRHKEFIYDIWGETLTTERVTEEEKIPLYESAG